MSQAIIEFCDGLKGMLLSIEGQLDKAKSALETGSSGAAEEAKKHVNEAALQLATFKAHANVIAQAVRADLPQQTLFAKEKLREFGQDAQVALRHAAVFLAEAAAKGAEGGAGALQAGARSAQRVAENLRHETAVAVVEPEQAPPAA